MKNVLCINTFMHVPYTYFIKWSKVGLCYYGVRYADNCDPSDLFVTYFTSSDLVKGKIYELGNPDIIQVRKTFDCAYKAKTWESKVLRRMKAVHRKDFLNRNDKMAPPTITREMLKDSLNVCKGDARSDAQKLAAKRHSSKMKGQASKSRIRITIFGKEYESTTGAMKQLNISYCTLKFIRDNDMSLFSSIDEVKTYIWEQRSRKLSQRIISEETKRKLSKAMKSNDNRKGHQNTKEHRKKVSKALKGKKPKIVVCPHCSKTGGINVIKRWHFDNCKFKFTSGA